MVRKSKYGMPVGEKEVARLTRRLPQYDECLRDFLQSGADFWRVNMSALPSKNVKVVLSSLKWRTKNKTEFQGIHVFSRKNNVYLERVKEIE